ncbi:MAG: hypothetical protein JWO31_2632 [Phycisphaerales bacterium]|nr:hypothetical protein [Phycisphaerales bacterium]
MPLTTDRRARNVIRIGPDVTVTVRKVAGRRVTLSIHAPPATRIALPPSPPRPPAATAAPDESEDPERWDGQG